MDGAGCAARRKEPTGGQVAQQSLVIINVGLDRNEPSRYADRRRQRHGEGADMRADVVDHVAGVDESEQ